MRYSPPTCGNPDQQGNPALRGEKPGRARSDHPRPHLGTIWARASALGLLVLAVYGPLQPQGALVDLLVVLLLDRAHQIGTVGPQPAHAVARLARLPPPGAGVPQPLRHHGLLVAQLGKVKANPPSPGL